MDLTYEIPERVERMPTNFDAEAANEVYAEDPVALAIIKRLTDMEQEVFLLQEEKAGLVVKEKAARKARDESMRSLYDFKNGQRPE